jgi:hypothetical protein
MDKYFFQTIEALKTAKQEKARDKAKKKLGKDKISVNVSDLGNELFSTICHLVDNSGNKNTFSALADTGATNSLMHTSVAHKLNLEYRPLKIGISTATGVDNEAVKGITNLKFRLFTENKTAITCCANFIISSRLNGLEAILGNEFLLKNKNIDSIKLDSIKSIVEDKILSVPLILDNNKVELEEAKIPDLDKNFRNHIDISCIDCGNKQGQKRVDTDLTKPVEVSHLIWN